LLGNPRVDAFLSPVGVAREVHQVDSRQSEPARSMLLQGASSCDLLLGQGEKLKVKLNDTFWGTAELGELDQFATELADALLQIGW
jgi:hypothetical protein